MSTTTEAAPGEPLRKTTRTTLRRLPERASYDRDAANAILDEALVCHVGFAMDGQPFVIPTIHARAGRTLYLHGSAASRMLREGQRVPLCVTVTLVDGLVMARSAFHHSMNYRSVVVLAQAREVTDPEEKIEALRAIVEHVAAGRWDEVRRPTGPELKGTTVLALPIDEASVKIRSGPPKDDAEDHALDVWAGVVPLRLVPGEPVADPLLREGLRPSDVITRYRRA
ncbi:MAG TPA: pyridoxamine 5'-phosphate oxidase family protein [Vicinamibacteria bacterium]|nr:pyridoxamine 5'-phosphate oxidase family protein [Vicinamibacteria bacterium]